MQNFISNCQFLRPSRHPLKACSYTEEVDSLSMFLQASGAFLSLTESQLFQHETFQSQAHSLVSTRLRGQVGFHQERMCRMKKKGWVWFCSFGSNSIKTGIRPRCFRGYGFKENENSAIVPKVKESAQRKSLMKHKGQREWMEQWRWMCGFTLNSNKIAPSSGNHFLHRWLVEQFNQKCKYVRDNAWWGVHHPHIVYQN